MPELPEVETIRRGLRPRLLNQKISQVIVRQPHLRWQVPKQLEQILKQQTIQEISRRGKYLLFSFKSGTLIIHLGMSGVLLIQPQKHEWAKHEHVNIIFTNGSALCYIDPRRFGTVLWTDEAPQEHYLLKHLGPEPLSPEFNAAYLAKELPRHKCSIKQFLMNSKIVVGIGNIYANEALFLANIRPDIKANTVSKERGAILVKKIKDVLKLAIKKNGTTIRDYATSNGVPGDFQYVLNVYGRDKQPCKNCHTPLEAIRLGQRNTVFCPNCQK